MKTGYKWYQKKRHLLAPGQLQQFESQLQGLDQAILKGDREEANRFGKQVEEFSKAHFKKSIWEYLFEMAIAIIIALVVATIVRQVWFELYEIPTGSMRPTFKEKDHLTVTKTAFGLNVPLATKHFYFDPNLVQRTSVAIWSGDGIPHLDSESTFMGIFPYTKRFIKRCLGKPGDTLYFYGGKIYGLDAQGNDLVELRDNPWMKRIENIPFTNFEGRRTYTNDSGSKHLSKTILHHFNQAVGRLIFLPKEVKGEIFNGREWVVDRPEAQRHPHDTIQTFSDFWGMRNFALGRLLTKDQLELLTPYSAKEMEEGILYLELRHTPSLSYPSPLTERFGVIVKGYSTVIPLQEKHLKALMDNMYTCRFIVQDGRANPYRLEEKKITTGSPSFPNVPNGTYEFYYGKALRIGWGGISSELPSDFPLYSDKPSNVQKLFNVGIEMNTIVDPLSQNQPFFPNRYAYFRDGALYVMGGVLMEKDDPLLLNFHEREKKERERGH